MPNIWSRRAVFCALGITLSCGSAFGYSFGSNDKDATIKVEKGGIFKGQSTLAIGSFRVAFTTEDSALSTSHGAFSNGGSSAKIYGQLTGVDHALMQKIADAVYADFLAQAAAKGYTILDSVKVAASSDAYRDTVETANFADSRIGTLVIPTGQRAVAMAADDSGKDSKGVGGFGSAFHNMGKSTAKSEANKSFPLVAKDTKTPILGVTIVVNFANFKGTSSKFGSSKATVEPGATIDGTNKNDLALFTSILAWDSSACEYINCVTRVYQQGQIHSDAEIGKASKNKEGGFLTGSKTTATIDADPALYETNVLAVSKQANEMLLTAIAKER